MSADTTAPPPRHGLILDILLRYARCHPGLLLLSAACVALAPIQEVGLPYLYGNVIAALRRPGVGGLASAGVWAMGTLLGVHACLLARDGVNDRIHASAQAFVKTELLDALLRKHSARYEPLTTGEIVYILKEVPDIACLWLGYMVSFVGNVVIVWRTVGPNKKALCPPVCLSPGDQFLGEYSVVRRLSPREPVEQRVTPISPDGFLASSLVQCWVETGDTGQFCQHAIPVVMWFITLEVIEARPHPGTGRGGPVGRR
jgi:hypothetical protein